MLQVPFQDFPAFSETTALDGQVYRLTFRWNTRGQYWTLKVSQADGTPILSGIKLVPDYELISAYVDMGPPPGLLFVVNPSGQLYTVTRDNLPSGEIALVYMTEAERAAL